MHWKFHFSSLHMIAQYCKTNPRLRNLSPLIFLEVFFSVSKILRINLYTGLQDLS